MPSSALPGRDPLSELLRVVRLSGANFVGVEAAGPWRLAMPGVPETVRRMVPGSEHVVACHIVTKGCCYGSLSGEAQVELAEGDVIVFPHGDAHRLWGERTALVSGYFGCDRELFNSLLAALPRHMHIRGAAGGWLGDLARRLIEESAAASPGADCIATRLAEAMLIELLRRFLAEHPSGQAGWVAGLRDEVVGRALTLLHARPAYPWDLAQLARQALSSRSRLAKRFMQVVGQPPMQYLAQWRMQLAASKLSESGSKVAAIGAGVGYDSEAAFSRAFKKATGVTPGAWRQVRRPASLDHAPGASARSASRQPISLR